MTTSRAIFAVGLLTLTLIISCMVSETRDTFQACEGRDARIEAAVRACR